MRTSVSLAWLIVILYCHRHYLPTFVTVHLEMLGFPMGGAYSYRDISAQFKTMRREQNSASVLGIQNENWGQPYIFQR